MRPPERRFPKVAADGSFIIRVIFASSPGEPTENVQDWLAAYIGDDSEWHASGPSRPFASYFSAPPKAELGTAGELTLLLHGVSDEAEKRFWKDWYARLCLDLLKRFPEAGEVARVENAQAA